MRRNIRLPGQAEYSSELARRVAMLDFLSLYALAKEDGIVDRVQFVTQAEGFGKYDPKGWETYVTRLMGRCIRHWIPESGMVVKQRQNMIYRVDKNADYLSVMSDASQIMELRYPYGPPYNDYLWVQSNRNAENYWKATTLFRDDPEIFDNLVTWQEQFMNQVNEMAYISFNIWYGVEVRYGNPMYRHGYRNTIHGRYNATEAYRQFKTFLDLADAYLGHETYLAIVYRMMDVNWNHESSLAMARDREEDPDTAETEEEEKQTSIQRVLRAARGLRREIPTAEERSNTLREQFMERLRERQEEE